MGKEGKKEDCFFYFDTWKLSLDAAASLVRDSAQRPHPGHEPSCEWTMSVARLVVDTRHVIGTGGVTSTDRVRLDQGTSPYSSAANCSAHQGAARPGSLRATFAGDWQSEGGDDEFVQVHETISVDRSRDKARCPQGVRVDPMTSADVRSHAMTLTHATRIVRSPGCTFSTSGTSKPQRVLRSSARRTFATCRSSI